MKRNDIENMALEMRRKILDISFECGHSTHIGGALSMVEVMSVLYGQVLKFDPSNPRWPDRDRFILSKGHGVLGYYPALLMAGIISEEIFSTFLQDGTDLIAHPVMNMDLGIESSNGSLGQGLSMAVGIALAAKKQNKDYKTYTLISDGGANEGSIWEAAMLAAHLKLGNLTMIVDYNRMQNDGSGKDIIDVENMSERFKAFGWHIIDVDGHDVDQILDALQDGSEVDTPKAIIAHTVKGKGVPFMENQKDWHHNRLTKVNYDLALETLGKESEAVSAT